MKNHLKRLVIGVGVLGIMATLIASWCGAFGKTAQIIAVAIPVLVVGYSLGIVILGEE